MSDTRAEDFVAKYNPAEEVRYLKEQLGKATREHDDYKKEVGGLRLLFDDLRSAVEALDPPKIDYKPPRKTRVATPVTHVCHWTDWHEGAVQEPEEVEGFGEFNPDILRRRVRNCVREQLEWCELHRKSYRVDVCHNLCTGDFVSGGIHQELLTTNAYPEPVQAVRAGEFLAEVVATQAPHYERVIVDFITTDNHGRLTKKPQAGEAGLNNFGYVVGWYAKERLARFPNVTFNVHAKIHAVVDCGGRKYLLTHGDRVKGWAGFPYYGLDRMVAREGLKRLRRVMRELREPEFDVAASVKAHLFDRVVLGHWHAPLETPWYLIGGSAQGTTAHDHGEGRFSEPIQCAWFVSPKYEFDRTNWLLKA